MGGKGSGRLNKTDAFLKKNTAVYNTVSPNLATAGNEVLVVPNHSGDHSAGRMLRTPENATDIANKQYVDDQIATVDLSDYWKRDGTSVASGDWALNTYDLTFTTGQINIGDHGAIFQSGDDLMISASEGAAEAVDIKGAWNRQEGLNINDGVLIANIGSSKEVFRLRRAGVTFLSLVPYNGSGLNWGMRKESYASGNNTIFTEAGNATKNHDHAAQTNPTIWGHSVTDPDTDNSQWWSLTHDQSNAVFDVGTGDFVFNTGSMSIGAAGATNIGTTNLQVEGGVLSLKETTTPTADTNYAKIYSKNNNELFWQDGAGTEHLLHGDSYSNLWYNSHTTSDVTISTQNAFTKIDSFTVVGKEDDLGNAVGSTTNNEIVISDIGAGEYEISFHGSVTATGGADKEMVLCMGIELATAKDITDVTDNTVTPIVITSTAHGFEDGDMVEISGVLGNTAANGSFFVNNKTANTFEIVQLDGTATTGNGNYDEGSPTGDITHWYVGNMSVHREVRGSTLGAVSATGLHDIQNDDKLAVYVANLDGTTDLTVAAFSFEVVRVGD